MREIITWVEFTVADRLLIADPCYIDKNDVVQSINGAIDGLGLLLDNCKGLWMAEAKYNRDGRVSKLVVSRADAKVLYGKRSIEARVGVDSGQMFIGCDSMFGLDYEELLEKYKLHDSDEWDHNLKFFGFGEGTVSGTGYGDGEYPVYVTRDHNTNKVIMVEVDFDESNENDEKMDWDE